MYIQVQSTTEKRAIIKIDFFVSTAGLKEIRSVYTLYYLLLNIYIMAFNNHEPPVDRDVMRRMNRTSAQISVHRLRCIIKMMILS